MKIQTPIVFILTSIRIYIRIINVCICVYISFLRPFIYVSIFPLFHTHDTQFHNFLCLLQLLFLYFYFRIIIAGDFFIGNFSKAACESVIHLETLLEYSISSLYDETNLICLEFSHFCLVVFVTQVD